MVRQVVNFSCMASRRLLFICITLRIVWLLSCGEINMNFYMNYIRDGIFFQLSKDEGKCLWKKTALSAAHSASLCKLCAFHIRFQLARWLHSLSRWGRAYKRWKFADQNKQLISTAKPEFRIRPGKKSMRYYNQRKRSCRRPTLRCV
jgi:hypothetical protein